MSSSSSSTLLPSLQEVLAACDDCASSSSSSSSTNESLILDYFQQLVAATCTTTDLAAEANKILTSTDLQSKLLLAANNKSTLPAVADILMDVIWLQASMMPTTSSSSSSSSSLPPPSPHFVTLIQTLAATIPSIKAGFLQSLDPSLLQAAASDGNIIIASEADLQKKMRMTNTQQFYRQYKFNLLAEESEGYAKFLTFILVKNQQEDEEERVEGTAKDYRNTVLQTLIGTFSLDPNRCLDLVLDVMEKELGQAATAATPGAGLPIADFKCHQRSTHNTAMNRLLDILQCLPLDKLPALLAFKLNGRLDDHDNNSSSQTPTLQCIAFLVLQKCLDLVDMMTFFPEWLEPLETAYHAVRKHEMQLVKAMDRVTLSSSSTSASSDNKNKEQQGVDLGPLKSHLTTRLIHLFLIDWNRFSAIQDTFQQEQWTRLTFLFPDTIGVAICDYVHREIQPFLHQPDTMSTMSLDDFLQIVTKPLAYVHESSCIMLRPTLYCQLCRLCHVFLEEKQDQQSSSKTCEDFIKTFLLPSLSLFPANPALSREMWRVLQLLPYRVRYRLYRSWRGCGLGKAALMATSSGAPGPDTVKTLRLISGEIQAAKDARYSLKRLSKDTIRDVSRAVAKVCHSHPLVVFTTILGQIESYDNLVQVMVDAMRFVTPLSLDVLGFCVLGRLSGSGVSAGGAGVNRSRLKEDGVNVSQWLQSLESFTGALYKRFPFLELRGILSYIMNRLKDGHVMELGVLRTLLKTSGGWAFADYAPVPSLSYTQLEGRAGSTLLKRETMSFGVFEDYNARASNSIRAVLQNDDAGVSLLILLAQVRHQIVFESTSSRPKPVKLIANLVDMCQVTMAILLDFLTHSAEDHAGAESKEASAIKKCSQSMPPLADLHQLYALDVASAWMLCRPLIRAASTALESGDVDDGAAAEVEGDTSPLQKFRPTDEMRAAFEKMLPESAWSHITTLLFESFYTSSLYDIYFPEDVYKAEVMRLEKEAERLSRQRTPPPASVQPGAAPAETDAEALERVKKALATLSSDQGKQNKHVAATRETIASKINTFFVSKGVSSQAATTFFVHCIFPRCMQGPDDALFCARFVALLHDLEVPGFSTLHFFDVMIVSLSRALFGLTEGEAANVSLLFNETWKVVSRWRYDEDAFGRECEGKPGSLMVKSMDGEEEAVPVSHEEYAALYNKWHASIGATALGCIRSSEYMHCRNSLIVLTRMLEYYPTKPKLANRLLTALQPLQEESYAFADIRASALAYGNQLVKARDSGVWKEESASDVKERQAKEQAEAAARQKKAQAQMEQIKRDSEKITEEIGEKDSRDTRRGDHRGPAWPQPRERGHGQLDDGRGGTGLSAEMKAFKPAPGRERVLNQGERRAMDDRRGPPPRETSGGGGVSSRDDQPPRDRPQGRGDSRGDPHAESPAVRRETSRETGQNDSRRVGISLDGRWHRAGDGPVRDGDGMTHGSKRSRPPSPVAESTDNNNRDEPGRASKRQRTENTDGRGEESGGRRSGRRRGARKS
jgi:THO complex subunit 2